MSQNRHATAHLLLQLALCKTYVTVISAEKQSKRDRAGLEDFVESRASRLVVGELGVRRLSNGQLGWWLDDRMLSSSVQLDQQKSQLVHPKAVSGLRSGY